MATGTKMYRFSKSRYFVSFLRSAAAAAPPTLEAVEIRCDGAKVSQHVKSQTSDRPRSHGIRVRPSGFLPSFTAHPGGSRMLGTSADLRARAMTSLAAP